MCNPSPCLMSYVNQLLQIFVLQLWHWPTPIQGPQEELRQDLWCLSPTSMKRYQWDGHMLLSCPPPLFYSYPPLSLCCLRLLLSSWPACSLYSTLSTSLPWSMLWISPPILFFKMTTPHALFILFGTYVPLLLHFFCGGVSVSLSLCPSACLSTPCPRYWRWHDSLLLQVFMGMLSVSRSSITSGILLWSNSKSLSKFTLVSS